MLSSFSLVITCREMVDLLVLLCVFFLLFLTFPHDVSGQVWYLIASIPNLCLLLYFSYLTTQQYFLLLTSFMIFAKLLIVKHFLHSVLLIFKSGTRVLC